MSYKGYASKESYQASKKKYYETHKPYIQEWKNGWYQEHREHVIAKSRLNHELNKEDRNDKNCERRRKIKAEVLTHYGKGKLACVRCGFDDLRALSIDHINGGGRQHAREIGQHSGTAMYSWLKKNNYPEGFQTLCGNCQWIKRDENHELSRKG